MSEDTMAGIETQPQPNPEAFHALKNPDFNSGNLTKYFSSDQNVYAPAYTPQEQGLPDYDTAMQESGLIK